MPSSAVAFASPEPSPATRFSLQARPEPGVMPRVLELFAKRGLVPERWNSHLSRPVMRLVMEIEIAGLADETVEYVANCLRQITGVETVLAA